MCVFKRVCVCVRVRETARERHAHPLIPTLGDMVVVTLGNYLKEKKQNKLSKI